MDSQNTCRIGDRVAVFKGVVSALLPAALVLGVLLAGCGGGGSGGGGAEAPPRSTAEAVRQQRAAAAEVQSLVEELISEENAAETALNEERYADFDAFWLERYPGWVDRFDAAAQRFARAEEFVRMFALTEQRAARAGGDPEAKFVPLPLVLLAAAAVTTIAAAEKERLARINDDVDDNEREALIAARERALRAQGLSPAAARTRAIADVTQVLVLQGLKNGIEHARVFVLEQVPGFFSGYLPQAVNGAIDLKDTADKIQQIRDNARVLLSDTGCETSGQQQRKIEEFPVCRIAFCEADDLRCDAVPPGEWGTAVFSDGFVRDEDTVTIGEGETGTATVSLFTPDEADEAARPDDDGDDSGGDDSGDDSGGDSGDDNGGGGDGDGGDGGFNEVREAAFTFRAMADGIRRDPDSGETSPEVRPVNISVAMLLPEAAFDCFPFETDDSRVGDQFGFLFRRDTVDGGSPATRVLSFVSGLIPVDPPETACRQLDVVNLLRQEEQADDSSIEGEQFSASLEQVPREELIGGSRFSDAQAVRFGLTGSAVCAAIRDFDFESADGFFDASNALCDSSSRMEVLFSR